MSDEKAFDCPHGKAMPIYCRICSGFDSAKEALDAPKNDPRWRTIARVTREDLREVRRGAEWEFKLEGVPTCMPRQRLTLRLTEGEAETLFKYAYMPSTGTLVKYKLRKALLEYLGSFLMDLIDATGLPILILPWGDPIGSWQAEA